MRIARQGKVFGTTIDIDLNDQDGGDKDDEDHYSCYEMVTLLNISAIVNDNDLFSNPSCSGSFSFKKAHHHKTDESSQDPPLFWDSCAVFRK